MSDARQEMIARHVAEYKALDEQERHIEASFLDYCGYCARLGIVLYLDALIASPDAVMAAIKRVRDDLVYGDPKLVLMK